jgi:uncharacterized DUF497 family protein
MIRVEWDDKKAEASYRKHGVRFEEAVIALQDPNCLERRLFENAEERWRTIGLGKDNLLFVVHTTRENGIEIIRIISARKANKKERKLYGNRKL